MNEQNIPQPNEPIQSSKHIWITIVVVVITAIVVGGGVYTWQKSNLLATNQSLQQKQQRIDTLENQVSQLKQTIESITSESKATQPIVEQEPKAPQISNIEDWKKYENIDYGFTFKYPEHYFITREGTWGERGTTDFKSVIDVSEYEVAPERQYSGIRIIIGDFSGNLYSYVEEQFNNYDSDWFGDKPSSIVETNVNGLIAYVVGNNLYFSKNGKLYSINNGIDKEIFDKIISTFVFVQ